MATLHGYQEAKENQQAWQVYDVLLEMIESLDAAGGADETDFEKMVRDSSEFSAFNKKRDQVLKLLGGNR